MAILVTAVLHVVLPAQYRVNPRWVVPVVLVGLLAVLIIGDPGRIDRQKPWLRIVTGIVIAFITVANLLAAARLFRDILTNNKVFANNATALLATGGVIWAANVIAFGLILSAGCGSIAPGTMAGLVSKLALETAARGDRASPRKVFCAGHVLG